MKQWRTMSTNGHPICIIKSDGTKSVTNKRQPLKRQQITHLHFYREEEGFKNCGEWKDFRLFSCVFLLENLHILEFKTIKVHFWQKWKEMTTKMLANVGRAKWPKVGFLKALLTKLDFQAWRSLNFLGRVKNANKTHSRGKCHWYPRKNAKNGAKNSIGPIDGRVCGNWREFLTFLTPASLALQTTSWKCGNGIFAGFIRNSSVTITFKDLSDLQWLRV